MSAATSAATRAAAKRLSGTAFPYFLLAPALLVFLVFVVYPLFEALRASTQFYRFGEAIEGVGLDNYADVLSDNQFWSSLWVTVRFVAIAVTLEVVLGLALALLCLREVRGIRYVRLTLIVPMVVMPVVVGIIFRLVYSADIGLFSILSREFGGSSVQILTNELTAFVGIVAVDVWQWTPFMFLILLAGLQSLPTEPLEAAEVDGATPWRVFWDQTFPMLRPVLAVAIVLRTIDAFGTFDQVFLLTQGGPGTATELVSLYGYETIFKFQQIGFGVAMVLMLAALVLALSFVATRVLRRAEV
jgi:multiple sugar transport system permease protein